jgi:hypothetical protein
MKFNTWIYQLAGDDSFIIHACDEVTKAKFIKIGLFIPLMFVTCFFSSYSTFHELFQNPLVSLTLALFFTWMLTNIYRLLLYTLTKSALPDNGENSYHKGSLLIRIGFVCFISLVISIPIESIIYSGALNKDLSIYKNEVKLRNSIKIKEYYEAQCHEIKKLSNDKEFKTQFIALKRRQCSKVIANMSALVNTSNYYLQRLKLLTTKHPSCWLITLLFMILFNFPVYKKHKIRMSDYYEIKGVTERNIVERDYYEFKKKYSEMFIRTYNEKREYSEPYQDAPYNTKRKQDKRKFQTEEDLLTELYNA